MPEELKRLGDYEILGILGAGGMGRVYKVRNVITDRVEAMKVLLPDLEGKEDVAARFLREIKLLAALHHPNIATLHTALTIDNQLVMVMEFVEGTSLSALLTQGAIPVPEALNYTDQVLDALSYAHQLHIIHRDIKPANMMITPEGILKLMDFGIAHADNEPAKLTATGTTLGSINYMSPEQVKGSAVDERSDLYSVGISLYEMVTGDKPFHGDSNFSIMAAHINQAPTPPLDLHPGLPAGLNEVILTSISKSADERFQSADAFRTAIGAVMRSLQESKTMVQGSQNTIMADAAMRAANLRTAPITAARTPVPTRTTATASSARTATAPAASPATPNPERAFSITPEPASTPSSRRGLYMGLGALAVLVVLVMAAVYMPSRKKSSVAAEPGTAASQPVQPPAISGPAANTPAVTTVSPAPPAPESTPPAAQNAKPIEVAKAPVIAKNLVTKNAPKQLGGVQSAGSVDNVKAAQAAGAAELDAIEHNIDQLTGRAGAVNSSLDNLQRQQASSGFGLRGDMASRQSSMKVNLAKAQNAIEHNDAERAKRYAAMAEADIEALEKFLGR